MEIILTALACMACFLLGAFASGGLHLPENDPPPAADLSEDPASEEISRLLGYCACKPKGGELNEGD